MLSKLNAVVDKYRELEALLSDPSVMADMVQWQRYTREHAALTPIVEAYAAYQQACATIAEDKEMLHEADAEMKEMLAEEIKEAEETRDRLAAEAVSVGRRQRSLLRAYFVCTRAMPSVRGGGRRFSAAIRRRSAGSRRSRFS